MEYKFNIELNKEYYSECFEQAFKYDNKWKNINYLISLIFISLGTIFIINAKALTFTSSVLIVIGFYELFDSYFKKIFWVKRQMSNKTANTEVEMIITEEAFLTKGKYSEGNMLWKGMDRILDTPKGLTIWPQKGIKIYIPKIKLNDEVVNHVLSKIA